MSSRRHFLKQAAAVGATTALAPALGCARARPAGPERARVVLVHCPAAIGADHVVDRGRVARMLERGLCELAGTRELRAALSQWLKPGDTVGLKVNCLGGRHMCTHRELVEALITSLGVLGLPRQHCIVFDRSDLDLQRAGFPVRTAGQDYRCLGNDRGGYEEEVRVMPSGASRCSRVATELASVLINLPVLKDHGIAGLSGALKNNFGLVHNPNKFHLNGCDPHVAEVNQLPFVRSKQRLVICDALRVQVEGGPSYQPAGAVSHGALLFATDAVALDIIAWELLEELRRKRKLPSLTDDRRRPAHVLTAARLGLGVGDRKRIDLIKVKVS